MKQLITVLTLSAFALASSSFAAPAEKKQKAETKAPAAEVKPAAEKAAPPAEPAKPAKPLPMNARVDMLDAAAKTFTTKRKADGVEVKHTVTDKTEIMNGDAAAKFEDLKVGDVVAGLRMKKGEANYEVVKITKFGPAAAKAAAKEATEKTTEPKKN